MSNLLDLHHIDASSPVGRAEIRNILLDNACTPRFVIDWALDLITNLYNERYDDRRLRTENRQSLDTIDELESVIRKLEDKIYKLELRSESQHV